MSTKKKRPILTRSYDAARTGANTDETVLTPQKVAGNVLVKHFSMVFNDDPRLEAQPLYVPSITMDDGKLHDVVYVCTMANNVWAFDAHDGKPIWKTPAHLGPPIKPKPAPHPGFPAASEIDIWGVNILWGVLSTPAIDLDTKRMYVVNWTSPDGTVDKAEFQLHDLNIVNGQEDGHPPLTIEATADAQTAGQKSAEFIASRQKQRASVLLASAKDASGAARKTLFVAFGMTHEEHDPTHGWLIAYDIGTFRKTAAWCTTPNGTGSGIWQAGQGPAADENGDVYLMTGNYGVLDANGDTVPPAPADLPESIVKLHYTAPPDATSDGKLEAVAWFTPFRDSDRNAQGDDDFQDYDLGSAGPLPIPGMSLVVGAGKDGVIYVLDKDTTLFGQGSDFSRLKQPPIFFTYFPGFGVDASVVHNLDKLFDGKTHHLHASPVFWTDPVRGPMLFVWGENECLRAWTIETSGKITFVAKSAEVASAAMAGRGGMPGGLLAVSSNGATPNTGIVWTLTPIDGDANKHVVEGILRAYDASNLDPNNNADGTPRLKLLWDSKHIPGNTFNHSKFCPPVVTAGKVFVPTYDGRVDVYALVAPTLTGPLPTNANGVPEPEP
jgi:outer membrane protein assembly factor BamB